MMAGCVGYGTLILVPVEIVDIWFGLSVQRLMNNIKKEPVFALIAVKRVV